MLARFCTYCGEILEAGACEVCLGNSTPSSRSADPRNSNQIRNDLLDDVLAECEAEISIRGDLRSKPGSDFAFENGAIESAIDIRNRILRMKQK